jgi:cobalt/nickel transport system permease protein
MSGLAITAGPHLLIGIGEGLIAATTVVTVAKVGPTWFYAPYGASAARRGRSRSR